MPGTLVVPGTSGTQETRVGLKSSRAGLASSRAVGLSRTPTLMTVLGPKVGPSRNSVLPQSPQKCDVTTLPESPVLAMVLGVPDTTLNPAVGTIRFVLYVEPVILRQSRQWQTALEEVLVC